jgi:translation elongation factor EF-1alpha
VVGLAQDLIEVGKIRNFYLRISVAVVDLTAPLKVGDTVLIKGENTKFEQIVESMQVEHENIQQAEAGKAVGMKVREKVRAGDRVFKTAP